MYPSTGCYETYFESLWFSVRVSFGMRGFSKHLNSMTFKLGLSNFWMPPKHEGQKASLCIKIVLVEAIFTNVFHQWLSNLDVYIYGDQ